MTGPAGFSFHKFFRGSTAVITLLSTFLAFAQDRYRNSKRLWGTIVLVVISSLSLDADASEQGNENHCGGEWQFGACTWKQSGKYVWKRPSHVRFILITGCGGGGGGSDSKFPGGNGAVIETQLVGPLLEPSYEINIGIGGMGSGKVKQPHPGCPNKPLPDNSSVHLPGNTIDPAMGCRGTATTIKGGSLLMTFPGGKGGGQVYDSNRQGATSTGYYGGVGYTGEGSVFALGGTAGDGEVHGASGYGSGGGGGIGQGGKGGYVHITPPGGIAGDGWSGGLCAGGGAGSSAFGNPRGGDGGGGFLRIIPFHDIEGPLTRSSQVVEQVLSKLTELENRILVLEEQRDD